MTVPYTSMDVLKYMAYRVRNTISWTVDSLPIEGDDGEHEIDALCALAEEFETLLGPLCEAWNHYSDGREIQTSREIEHGFTTSHVWHPDPAQDTEQTYSGRLLADPGENNGTYEVRIVPPQEVTVRTFPPLRAV